jgi:hypothetical protein
VCQMGLLGSRFSIFPPRPGTQNCFQLFQLIAPSDHMSTREKLIAEADYSSASPVVILEAMAEETSALP